MWGVGCGFPVVHWPALVLVGMHTRMVACSEAEVKQAVHVLTISEWIESCTTVLDADECPFMRLGAGISIECSEFNDNEYLQCKHDMREEDKGIKSLTSNINAKMLEGSSNTSALQATRTQRTARLQELSTKLKTIRVHKAVQRELVVGSTLEVFYTPTPPRAAADAVLGLVQDWEASVFLRDGCYRVTVCVPEDRDIEVAMDFTAMSRCLVPEGRVLYLELDAEGMQQLNAQGFSISNAALMQQILDDEGTVWQCSTCLGVRPTASMPRTPRCTSSCASPAPSCAPLPSGCTPRMAARVSARKACRQSRSSCSTSRIGSAASSRAA